MPNRAAWSERLEQEMAQWQQHGNTLLIAMLDLDHFKRINDNYGHLAGDKVLKIIAASCASVCGPVTSSPVSGRGVCPAGAQYPDHGGLKLVEGLRAAIEACPFHFKGERVTITVSVGLSAFRAGERSDHALKRADEALYRAKNAGRNRIEQG
ncbi:GGDEF domain-containing protein [Pseudomonas sp. PCH446]